MYKSTIETESGDGLSITAGAQMSSSAAAPH